MLLLAANPVFIANCGDGMETPLFMALMVECARASLAEPSRRSGTWVGVLTAACIWTRPEALPLLLALPAVPPTSDLVGVLGGNLVDGHL